MSDIRCVICGEPWDSFGVNHGDMLKWEAKLFKQGAGCPCCEGESSNGYTPQTLSDVENGDDDPIERIHAAENVASGNQPKWERPQDPIHWECDGCEVQVISNVDTNELEYHVRYSSKARHWYSSHPFDRHGDPEKEPAHRFEIAKDTFLNVCEFCLTHCSNCDAPLSELLELETYDEGCALPSPADEHEHVCIDCLGEVETEAAEITWRDCYSDKERIEYMRDHWEQFDSIRSFKDLMSCARGKSFWGWDSELLS